MILFLHLWIKGLDTGRQYDRSHFYLFFLCSLPQIYCLIPAYCRANMAFFLFEVETAFVNICNQGNGLSEIYMYGLIFRYLLIVLIRILNGAILHTGSAPGAFVLNNIPWPLGQGYYKVSQLPFYTVDFSVGEDLDIRMPADLDQLGRQNSHGAVIGGKGLVQLCHMAANAWRLFNQVNFEAGSGKIERGLDAADATTNNHYVSKIVVFKAPAEMLESLLQEKYLSHFL
jgi:hypothetical protein